MRIPASTRTSGALAAVDAHDLAVDVARVARREEREHRRDLRGLADEVSPAPVVRVPYLRSDVHDLDGLAEIAHHLFD